MTKAGKLETEFNAFKVAIEARLTALEQKSEKVEETKPTKKSKSKDIVVETKDNDIVASEEQD